MPKKGLSKSCKSIRTARKKVVKLMSDYIIAMEPVPLDAGPELTQEECEVIRALVQALNELCPMP